MDVDFEPSKENILPLAKGRVSSALRDGLHPEDAEFHQKRREFEASIRNDEGSDPLAPWHSYIQWTQQHFPRGTKDGKLDELIERCVEKFKNKPAYREDPRLLDIYINYASQQQDPSEIYRHLFENFRGVRQAKLYLAWAWEKERVGNTGGALWVLDRGKNNLAEPKELLAEAEKCLLARVVKGTTGSTPHPMGVEYSRQPMQSLRHHGSGHKVAVDRTSDIAVENKAPGKWSMDGQSASNTASRRKRDVRVLQTESEGTVSPARKFTSSHGVLDSRNDQENVREAARWTESGSRRVGKRHPTKTTFQVHQDEHEQDTQIISSSGPKLREKGPDEQQSVCSRPVPSATERYMVDLDRLYGQNGEESQSIEQYRAKLYLEGKVPQNKRVKKRMCFDEEMVEGPDGTDISPEEIRAVIWCRNPKNPCALKSCGRFPTKAKITEKLQPNQRFMFDENLLYPYQPYQFEQQIEQVRAQRWFEEHGIVANDRKTVEKQVEQQVEKLPFPAVGSRLPVEKSPELKHQLAEACRKVLSRSATTAPAAEVDAEEMPTRFAKHRDSRVIRGGEWNEDKVRGFRPAAVRMSTDAFQAAYPLKQVSQDPKRPSTGAPDSFNLVDPTVNTKEAMAAIENLWAGSFCYGPETSSTAQSESGPSNRPSVEQLASGFAVFNDDDGLQQNTPPKPFSVYDETTEAAAPASGFAVYTEDTDSDGSQAKPGFVVYREEGSPKQSSGSESEGEKIKENLPPVGYVQKPAEARELQGVLQPSVGVQCAVLDRNPLVDGDSEIEELSDKGEWSSDREPAPRESVLPLESLEFPLPASTPKAERRDVVSCHFFNPDDCTVKLGVPLQIPTLVVSCDDKENQPAQFVPHEDQENVAPQEVSRDENNMTEEEYSKFLEDVSELVEKSIHEDFEGDGEQSDEEDNDKGFVSHAQRRLPRRVSKVGSSALGMPPPAHTPIGGPLGFTSMLSVIRETSREGFSSSGGSSISTSTTPGIRTPFSIPRPARPDAAGVSPLASAGAVSPFLGRVTFSESQFASDEDGSIACPLSSKRVGTRMTMFTDLSHISEENSPKSGSVVDVVPPLSPVASAMIPRPPHVVQELMPIPSDISKCGTSLMAPKASAVDKEVVATPPHPRQLSDTIEEWYDGTPSLSLLSDSNSTTPPQTDDFVAPAPLLQPNQRNLLGEGSSVFDSPVPNKPDFVNFLTPNKPASRASVRLPVFTPKPASDQYSALRRKSTIVMPDADVSRILGAPASTVLPPATPSDVSEILGQPVTSHRHRFAETTCETSISTLQLGQADGEMTQASFIDFKSMRHEAWSTHHDDEVSEIIDGNSRLASSNLVTSHSFGLQEESLPSAIATDVSTPEGFPPGVVMKPSGLVDPHDPTTLDACLASLPNPLNAYASVLAYDEYLPSVREGVLLELGGRRFGICELIGTGAYAAVFRAEVEAVEEETTFVSMMSEVALKYETPAPCKWEMYICAELHERLKALRVPYNVRQSVIKFQRSFIFPNGSLIVSNYAKNGTLLDLVNLYRQSRTSFVPEAVAVCLAYEILQIMEKIHQVNMIHADIKPDNFLIIGPPNMDLSAKTEQGMFGSASSCVQLIDFGRSIDMNFFPPGTVFDEINDCSGFTCTQMLQGKPWTFETDHFGVAGTLYVILCGRYMNVTQDETTGLYKPLPPVSRRRMPIWTDILSTLINGPADLDVAKLRQDLVEAFVNSGHVEDAGPKIREMVGLLHKPKK